MNTPNIKVGDILKLRDGTPQKVLETDAPGDRPIITRDLEARPNQGGVISWSFGPKGNFYRDGTESENDLILPKRRVLPWNKLTDVELEHEYLVEGQVGNLTGAWTTPEHGVCLRIKGEARDFARNVKHRARGTTEWLECDKDVEE